VSLSFQWLGTASLVFKAGDQVLAVDPFFTRPSLPALLRPLVPNRTVVTKYLPECDFVLLTHAHYDHLLDVPEVMQYSAATAYGSTNSCHLLAACGAPVSQISEITIGDRPTLGAFNVEVIQGQHSRIPLGRFFNGTLRSGLKPPLFAWDYRMDFCLGFRITAGGSCVLICAAGAQPAEVWFAVAQEPPAYYQQMLQVIRPQSIVLIHWDNFTRPLSMPLRRFARPGRLSLQQLETLVHQSQPGCHALIPEFSKEYQLTALP
jgi:L-ascorbate metabolism protein UlaG (beta-lactamase superfamily)